MIIAETEDKFKLHINEEDFVDQVQTIENLVDYVATHEDYVH